MLFGAWFPNNYSSILKHSSQTFMHPARSLTKKKIMRRRPVVPDQKCPGYNLCLL